MIRSLGLILIIFMVSCAKENNEKPDDQDLKRLFISKHLDGRYKKNNDFLELGSLKKINSRDSDSSGRKFKIIEYLASFKVKKNCWMELAKVKSSFANEPHVNCFDTKPGRDRTSFIQTKYKLLKAGEPFDLTAEMVFQITDQGLKSKDGELFK